MFHSVPHHERDYSTKLAVAFRNPAEVLFKSDEFEVGVLLDTFAKLPSQVVVAPLYGISGSDGTVYNLPAKLRRRVHEVADFMGSKILQQGAPDQRVITHTEGFAIPTHAHIVMFAAWRRQGSALYEEGRLPNPALITAAQSTLQFDTAERIALTDRLSQIS